MERKKVKRMLGILGRKLGMTSMFNEAGRVIPVTLIEAADSFVLDTKTKEKAGYFAIVLGYEDKKPRKVKKSEKGWFDKRKIAPKKVIKEIRLDAAPGYKIGDKIEVTLFKTGDYVDVAGTSIGKGFQGGMKRWNWSGGEAGHGSMFHRAPGSIGASSFPSRVHKGKTMPGHMGNAKITVQNLEVASVDGDNKILALKGAVPGYKGSLLVIRYARKIPPSPVKPEAKSEEKKKDETKK